jgi:hypothetical protein
LEKPLKQKKNKTTKTSFLSTFEKQQQNKQTPFPLLSQINKQNTFSLKTKKIGTTFQNNNTEKTAHKTEKTKTSHTTTKTKNYRRN